MGLIVEHKPQQLRTFRVPGPEATGIVFPGGQKEPPAFTYVDACWAPVDKS
jgi:hypothetical protein